MATIIRGYNITHNRLEAQRIADQRKQAAQKKGYILTGYEPYTLRSNRRGGGFDDTRFDMPIYGRDPAVAAPAPPPAPAPAPPVRPSTPTTPTNNYQSQIASLTASIQQQQQENARAQAAAQAAADQRAAAARQAAQKDYQSQLSSMQNLYASNLQSTKDQFGLQISGLQKSMTDQAADFKTQQQTMATNQERARLAGATPELKLQQSADQKIGGTTTFKKRLGTQFNAPTYGSLATIKSGTLNI